MAEFKLEGLKELEQKLQEMGNKTSRIENKAIKKAAEPILEDAKANAPVDTGRLREGLKISNIKTKNGEKYVEVGITKGDNSEMFYGKFIEWGTSKMPAKPYLAPAYEKNKSKIKEIIIKELKKGLGL
ncbi:HK97-gp10 family putative phage morphogenesis protein [Tepidibacter thalassicus]|uniref:Phage protein, HK97 gp10 family n=1 Tax=Tepidibacter thalassicus DSM 15285 TaxID=1123350 RepID=A0A1M5PVR9_9FIRM|nr:HK97-gp10 family putative phage morphogenesis protein [Tepidibacter thalassicus]SHH05918.1 phage protein, HK97 gp10 family [Tepidibacter thalassicus DSM 15285]